MRAKRLRRSLRKDSFQDVALQRAARGDAEGSVTVTVNVSKEIAKWVVCDR